MLSMKLLGLLGALLCIYLHTGFCAEGDGWAYETRDGHSGPDKWKNLEGSEACGSTVRQSPIHITRSSTIYRWFTKFKLGDFTRNVDQMQLKNTGLQVTAEYGSDIFISGGSLPRKNRYKLAGFHFHWGNSDSIGAEHRIDGNFYPLELHAVHYDTTRHDTVGDAVVNGRGDALAVLGVFFKIGQKNCRIDRLIKSLKNVVEKATEANIIPGIPFINFLPENIHDFWRYAGSLTTPGCHENVIWTLFRKPVEISTEQMLEFRKLESIFPGKPLVDNFRHLHPLNGRTVYRSFYDSSLGTEDVCTGDLDPHDHWSQDWSSHSFNWNR